MTEVVVDVTGTEIVSAITQESADTLKLQLAASVTVIIKATELILATE
jgi:molybdopterin-binding protein